MKKRVTGLVLAGALGLGGIATGFVVAAAATSETTAADAVSDRVSQIREALAGLVSNGTINRQQADRVAETLADRLPRHGGPHGRHGGHGGRGGFGGGEAFETAAEALGVSVEELRAELGSGQSLADVAAECDVPKEELIDRLVTAAEALLDEHVAEAS